MRGIIRLLFVLIFVTIIWRFDGAYGQGGATGAISGSVVDASGGAIADAEVQVINSSTGVFVRHLNANPDGSFVITLLPPGTYYAVINKSGFSEAKATGIEVRVTETARATIILKPGTVTEKVEISALVATVDTTSATTGQSIGENTVRTLPLATQNFQQLLTLSAGAQSDLNNSTQLGRGDVRIIVNGQREDNNNYLIEGISATDYNVAELTNTPLPNADVIQEFKVQTSLYDATQGRNGGGNINAILKTGTRQYHGDAYEFFRNNVLNANDYFLNASGQNRAGPETKYFWRQRRWARGNGEARIFLRELPGYPATQRPLPRHFHQHSAARHSPGSLVASLTQAFFPQGLPAGVTLDPVAVALLQFKSNQFGGASNGYLIPSVADTEQWRRYLLLQHARKIYRRPIYNQLGQGIPWRRRQDFCQIFLLQFAYVRTIRRGRSTGFLGWQHCGFRFEFPVHASRAMTAFLV